MHYYPHNIADYRKDTMHLNLLEHGCYRQLIDQYYLNEEPLPLDKNKLFRLINARTQDEQNAIEAILTDFFTQTEVGYVHKRCNIEIEAYQSKSEVASKAAKKRWKLGDHADAMRTHSERNANQEPITINQEPLTNNHIISIDHYFDQFWSEYPKKVGKQKALTAWNKTRPDITQVLEALAWQKKSRQWLEKGGCFVPNPATWINQHRWNDEPPKRLTF